MELPRPPAGRRHTTAPPMRRNAEGRAIALGRDGRELTRRPSDGITPDQFDIPDCLREPGWTQQWAASECLGKEISGQIANMKRQGWDFIPSRRADGHFHPEGYDGPIYREGQYLMERPQILTDEANAENIAAARRQRRNQASAFAGVEKVFEDAGTQRAGFEASSGTNDSRGVARPKLNRTIEGIPGNLYPAYKNELDPE